MNSVPLWIRPLPACLALFSTVIVQAQFSEARLIDHAEVAMPYTVRLGDIDGDGDLDVACTTASYDSEVIWFPNTGDGYFLPRRVIDGGSNFGFIQLVDLDLDGDLDLLGTGVAGDVYWTANEGGGNFGTEQLISTVPQNGKDVYAADLDGDGDMDVLSASYDDDRIAWYANNGQQQFGPQQIIATMNNAYAVRTHDLDGDGDMDVVVGGQTNPGLAWYSNNGSGTFTLMPAFTPPMTTGGELQIADMNGDGHDDIVAQGVGGGRWYANDGQGVFTSGNTVPSGVCIGTADLDADGDTDVINGNGGLLMRWWPNDGTGTFTTPFTLVNGYDAWAVDEGDMNGDGIIDVVCAFFDDSHLTINLGLGAGAFEPPRVIAQERDAIHTLRTADLNGDGLRDVIETVTNEDKVSWFPNLGNNSFGLEQVATATCLGAGAVRAADIDGDGDQDLISTGEEASVFHTEWYANDGAGLFGPAQVLASGSSSGGFGLEVVDMDGDGDIDVVAANASVQYVVFINDGAGNFTEGAMIVSGYQGGLALGDLDGDGDVDALSGSSTLGAYLNDGGTFTQSYSGTVSGDPLMQLMALDMDLDGDLDLTYCDGGYDLNYNRNNGDGTFEDTLRVVPVTWYTRSFWPGDIDGDGMFDLLCEADAELIWLHNEGGGSFTVQPAIHPTVGASKVHLADLDNDGDPDPIAGSPYYGHLLWHENYYLSAYRFEGTVFLDSDGNGAQDMGEPGLSNPSLQVAPGIPGLFPLAQGYYTAHVDPGTYTVTVNTDPQLWTVTTPDPHIVEVSDTLPALTGVDVGITPLQDVSIMSPSITLAPAVCSANTSLWVSVANMGTRIEQGMLRLAMADSFTFVSSTPMPDAVVGDTLVWDFDELLPFATLTIPLVVTMPSVANMGDPYSHNLEVVTLDEFNVPNGNWASTYADTLVCSYDPNDKLVDPAGYGVHGAVDLDQDSLDYTIRFQNTGNAPAVTVMLRDLLDGVLDPGNIQLLGSSHTITLMRVEADDELVVRFDGIGLPGAMLDPVGSQGFVRFRIRPDLGAVQHLSTAHNTAGIYFDLNAPVITNTTLTTWVDCALWQPGVNVLWPDTLAATTGDAYQWYMNGQELIGETGPFLVPLVPGSYAVEVTSQYGCIAFSAPVQVITVGITSANSTKVVVQPNPFTAGTRLVMGEALDAEDELVLFDTQGRAIRTWRGAGTNEIWIPRGDLTSGIYMLHVMRAGDRPVVVKLVVE